MPRPARTWARWVLLAPVVAMASSWALLGEAPGAAELAGALLLVTGVLTAQGTLRPRGTAKRGAGQGEAEPELQDRHLAVTTRQADLGLPSKAWTNSRGTPRRTRTARAAA